jgi:hypothetical protein
VNHGGPEERAPDSERDEVPDELVEAAHEELENPADETDEG